jgi:hypothetical protein
MGDSIRCELGFEGGKMLHHQRRQEPIFTKGEQVLFVESVDVRVSVLVNDTV